MKGIYCLIITIKKDFKAKIGALNLLSFKRGVYAYIGSAQNNLEKRIQRHLSKKKKIRWHIDYLLKNKNTAIKKVIYKKASKEEECRIARTMLAFSEAIGGFGCSDCKCCSHLFKLKNLKHLDKLGMEDFESRWKK